MYGSILKKKAETCKVPKACTRKLNASIQPKKKATNIARDGFQVEAITNARHIHPLPATIISIHVSEMDSKPDETLTIEQTVLVRIVAIDPERERISLSLTKVTLDEHLSWLMQFNKSRENIVERVGNE